MARGVPMARGTPVKMATKKGFDHGLEKLRDSPHDNVHTQWSSPLQVPAPQTNQSLLPLVRPYLLMPLCSIKDAVLIFKGFNSRKSTERSSQCPSKCFRFGIC